MHARNGFRFVIRALTLLVALVPMAVWAGGTATLDTGDQTRQLYWQDDGAVRIGAPDASHYMIFRDQDAYTVSMENGQPQVMEMGGMVKMFSAMGGLSGEDSLLESVQSVKATGESKTVAGIKGHVYEITIKKKDGTMKTEQAVLTDDPRVVGMTDAYLDAIGDLLGNDMVDKLRAALPKKDRGLLRSGDDFKLVSITEDEPAASLFELPAEPKNFAQMMQKMMKKMKEQSGR